MGVFENSIASKGGGAVSEAAAIELEKYCKDSFRWCRTLKRCIVYRFLRCVQPGIVIDMGLACATAVPGISSLHK